MEEKAKERLDTCKQCEQYYEPTTTCKMCGCFMIAKVKFKNVNCPLKKW